MKKTAALICLATLLSACGTLMTNVMRECEQTPSAFPDYAACIRHTYDAHGRNPNSSPVREFYAELDVLVEAYNAGKISEAQARAGTYRAYEATVGRNNRAVANSTVMCSRVGNSVVCN